MRESLFVEERRRLILDSLRQDGRVSVKGLSQKLRVSAVTIRQDLRALEDEGLLERTYGGAVPHESQINLPELSFQSRMRKRRKDKEIIAERAVKLVQEGFCVALDASSTAYAAAEHLKQFRKLTIVTNSLVIAQGFLDTPQIQVILPGGRMRRDSISVVGFPQGLPNINFNIGFFGARGISLTVGVTDIDADEVAIKRAMFERCVHPIVVIDGSKWGQVAPFTFIRPDEVRHVITSSDAPMSEVEQMRMSGALVEIAEL
ncbi:MAG: DeoR/GlpR family DNA-binding transcription regulator [Anaerolineae bacterium]|nr:DeoR/GlpR family DNA-binding transcription regulator [Anaerolineae bacterium]NUQ04358.1 DeoR/GlpR transcriptional regulator [Anaerolineae bacterium]